MELQAVALKVTPIESGKNKNGEEWQKVTVLFETVEHYPKHVAISFMNKLCTSAARLAQGTLCRIKFDAESHEFNGRFYTELRAWSLTNVAQEALAKHQATEAQQTTAASIAGQQPPQTNPIQYPNGQTLDPRLQAQPFG